MTMYFCLLRWYTKALDMSVRALAMLKKLRFWSSETRTEYWCVPDREHIVRTLLAVHGEQLLIHGVFNADPHPGNFLLLPDGRIGLIDFGQVKRISLQVRKQLARLFLAVLHRDNQGIVEILKELGVRSKKMD